MQLLEWTGVPNKRFLSEFVDFPYRLYAGCPNWIPGLKCLDRSLFSANPALISYDIAFFLVKHGENILGRIAVFKDRRPEYKECPARFGWLDFIDDPEVTSTLFSAAESWVVRNGPGKLQGPLGFTDFDKTGILVSGFECPASFHSSYNFPYYQTHLLQNGYTMEADWYEWIVHSPGKMPESLTRAAQIARKKFGIDVMRKKSATRIRKLIPDLFGLINESYQGLYGFTRFEPEQIRDFEHLWLSLLPKDFFSIVLHPDGAVLGFAFALPSLNSAARKSHGHLFPSGFLRFPVSAYIERQRADLLLVAVRNQYQNKGVMALLVEELLGNFLRLGINEAHAHWQMSDNQRITNLWKRFRTDRHKRRACFGKKLK